MSIEAMSWVLRHSEERLGRRLVLLVLADHANDDGTGAWPSVETISEKARMSRAQTQRCLRELTKAGSVEKVGKSPAGTTVYDVVMGGPHIEAGASNPTEGGLKYAVERGVNEARTTLEPSIEQPPEALESTQPKPVRVDGRDLPFDVLAEVCGIRADSPRMKSIPATLNGPDGIRRQVWREIWGDGWDDLENYERQIAIEIRARAALYRRKLPGAALTPTALAKWWTDLPGLPDARDGRSGSAADVIDSVDAAVRRARGES